MTSTGPSGLVSPGSGAKALTENQVISTTGETRKIKDHPVAVRWAESMTENFATLADALPNFAAQSTGVIPGDVPEMLADRYRLYLGLLFSSKPIVTGTFEKQAFAAMHEMLSAVVGDADRLRRRFGFDGED